MHISSANLIARREVYRFAKEVFVEKKEYEQLTDEICKEYRRRAKELPKANDEDVGAWRELRIELQNRCNIPELWAYNILRGHGVKDYIHISGIESGEIEINEEMKARIEAEKYRKMNSEEKKHYKKSKDEKLKEYAERIEFLESMLDDNNDEFGFEEKD